MRGRKLKATHTDSAPTVLVTVGAESYPAPWSDPKGGCPYILERAHVTVTRRGKAGWGKTVEYPCPGWADVWDVIDALAAGGRLVYVVAGRASDLLVQLRFWERVERKEVSVWEQSTKEKGRKKSGDGKSRRRRHPLVMNGRPDIIGYSLRGCSFRWVSVSNWADVSIRDCANQIGYPVPGEANESDKWESMGWGAEHQSRIVCGYMKRLISWWIGNGCGHWKDTPGSAAWSTFTRRGGFGDIIQHADPLATKLESAACFGGRAATFYFGSIGDPDQWAELHGAPPESRHGFGVPGPVHRLDISSMYPTLLRDRMYPTRLLAVVDRPSVAEVRRGLRSALCLASVTVRPTVACIPRRNGNGCSFPLGTFRTVLSSPELLHAIDQESLLRVHRVAWYTPGSPFRSWCEWVLGLRTRAKAEGDVAGAAWVKLLANSLGGRLARRKQGWEACPDAIPHELWGPWHHIDTATGDCVERRILGGLVQEMRRDDNRPGTLTAAYAHLTAYGRCLMNDIRDVAGRRQTLWQDTDGLIVTDLGRDRLTASQHYGECQYGRLRHDGTFSCGRFLTAKHYWLDGKWTLCGIHDGFSVPDGRTAVDVVTLNPVRSARRPDSAGVYRIVRSVDLTLIEPGVSIDPYGWAVPEVVGDESTATPAEKGQGELWPE